MRLVSICICILFVGGLQCGADDADFLVDPPIPSRKPSVLPSMGGAISANPVEWSFFTIIVIPMLSCDTTARIPGMFNEALRVANPDVAVIKSTPVRLESDVCVDGVCFCEEGGDVEHSVRVLELKTLCSSGMLFLPTEAEFPFEYDARDQEPSPVKRKI
jgi:hypothetical protein